MTSSGGSTLQRVDGWRRHLWPLMLFSLTGWCASGCQHTTWLPGSGDASSSEAECCAEAELAYLKQVCDEWAAQNVQEGDLIFEMGETRYFFNLLDVSAITSKMADSPFSHCGIAVVKEGRVYVCDIVRHEGVRLQPFSEFVCKYQLAFGVKRLRPEYRHAIPPAIEFCRQMQEIPQEFDVDFSLENDKLYCVEMVETAFRYGGVSIADPVLVRDLPRYDDFPVFTRLLQLTTNLTPDQYVLHPGNPCYGFWGSPKLEHVYFAPQGPKELLMSGFR